MQLSTLQLLVNSNLASNKTLDVMFRKNDNHYSDKEYFYKIEELTKIDENIYWLYARYGSATPYCEDVIDIDSSTSSDNPRNIKQVEPRNQLFCIYDTQSKLLFVNNLNMKNKIQNFFQNQLNQVDNELLIDISNVIINEESFAQQISTLSEISFKYREDLLNSHVLGVLDMFPAPKSLLGVDMNEEPDYHLSIKLHNARIGEKFLSKFKSLVKLRRDGDLKDLMIVGKDSNLIDTIFKIDSITKKLSLNVKADEQTKLYESEQVKSEFMNNLKRVGHSHEKLT